MKSLAMKWGIIINKIRKFVTSVLCVCTVLSWDCIIFPFSPLLSVGIFDEPCLTGSEFIFIECFRNGDFFFLHFKAVIFFHYYCCWCCILL